jgi:integrase/recombinase XerD
MNQAPHDLETFKAYLITQKQLSPGVARDYTYLVGKFSRWAHTADPTKVQAVQYFQELQHQGYANSSIGNTVFALNHYFRFLGKKVCLRSPKRHERQPAYLTVEEAQLLVRIVPNLRDRAIVMTLLYTGMRVSELCNLDLNDLHLNKREIIVRDTKTYRDRKVVVSEKCATALNEYLESISTIERNAVFISRTGKRISRGRVYAMVKQYGRQTGIQKKVTPHVLRHTLATNMITHGASVVEVKQQLGHQSLKSTLRYVHLQIDQRKKLYEEHCPPF